MKNIAVIAGGNSGEYEVSLKTGANICKVLDRTLFNPYFIHFKGIEWTYTDENGIVHDIDKNDFSLTIDNRKITFDAAFIAIHGNPGEDGKLQGYFDMLKMPYTGCDLMTSALTFNKYFCNLTAAHFGLPISPSICYRREDTIDKKEVERICGYPCFVKPCNSGSSVGVTKVHAENELAAAIKTAFDVDEYVMIEKFIPGREVTCGVAKISGKATSLAVTEIISKNEFYDFESKYKADLHEMVTPADFPQPVLNEIMRYSEIFYHKTGMKGVVRMDYIITPDNKPFFLEVNTIPGQTALSIIPHQIEHIGKDLKQVYTDIILEALNN